MPLLMSIIKLRPTQVSLLIHLRDQETWAGSKTGAVPETGGGRRIVAQVVWHPEGRSQSLGGRHCSQTLCTATDTILLIWLRPSRRIALTSHSTPSHSKHQAGLTPGFSAEQEGKVIRVSPSTGITCSLRGRRVPNGQSA